MNHLSPSSSSAYSSKEKKSFFGYLYSSLYQDSNTCFSNACPLAIHASNSQNFSQSSNACCPKKNFLLHLFLSHIYISTSLKEPPKSAEGKSTFLSYFLPFCNRFPHGNNIRAILLKTQSPLFSKFCWFSFQINGGPFPHAQKINK